MATKTKTATQARKPRTQEAAKKPTKATTTRAPKASAEVAKQDTDATAAKQAGKRGKAKTAMKAEVAPTIAIESANAKSAADAPVTKKLSAIGAAAQVLASSGPLNCKELIEAMATQGLWTSPGGKTPHATLYSAILREITVKGNESRFVKTERGRFAAK